MITNFHDRRNCYRDYLKQLYHAIYRDILDLRLTYTVSLNTTIMGKLNQVSHDILKSQTYS